MNRTFLKGSISGCTLVFVPTLYLDMKDEPNVESCLCVTLKQVLRQENVEYVVAPYEADAQMAFLARNGHVDLVITEDSDLIAYACPKVLFNYS